MSNLPDSLVVVPLENKVLLPSVVLKLTMKGKDASNLTRKHFRLSEQRKAAYVVVIPLKQSAQPSMPSQDDTTGDDKTLKKSASSNNGGDTTSTSLVKQSSSQVADDQLLLEPHERDLLYDYGCVARILRVQRSGLGVFSVFVEGVSRCKVDKLLPPGYEGMTTATMAKVTYLESPVKQQMEDVKDDLIAFRALAKEFLSKIRELQLPDHLTAQLSKLIDNVSPLTLADLLVSVIETSFEEKLLMLSMTDPKERLVKASEWMTRQLHVLKISEQIHSSIEGKLSKKQREFYLRQQVIKTDKRRK
jgi:ATP-dependent Lon protease